MSATHENGESSAVSQNLSVKGCKVLCFSTLCVAGLTVDDFCIAAEHAVSLPWDTLEHRYSCGNGEQKEYSHSWPWPGLYLLEDVLASGKLKADGKEDAQH